MGELYGRFFGHSAFPFESECQRGELIFCRLQHHTINRDYTTMSAPTPTLSESILHPRDETSLRLASNAYPARSVSHISATEAFVIVLDNAQCVVCGYDLKECLAHCHYWKKHFRQCRPMGDTQEKWLYPRPCKVAHP